MDKSFSIFFFTLGFLAKFSEREDKPDILLRNKNSGLTMLQSWRLYFYSHMASRRAGDIVATLRQMALPVM
jgi:hypothetical protein